MMDILLLRFCKVVTGGTYRKMVLAWYSIWYSGIGRPIRNINIISLCNKLY